MKLKRTIFSLFILLILSCNLTAQNYALHMDGTDNKVGIVDSDELNPTEALTIEAWIKAAEWPSSIWAGVIVGKQGTNPDKGYCFTGGENGRIEFTVSVDEAWKSVATPAILGTNTWYHVAGVFDGSQLRIYVNGILQNTTDINGTLTPGAGVVMNIGDNPTWQGRFWNGVIDEVRIWNVVRTEEEIQATLTTELNGNETGLVAYYPMNEGTGTTISDMSTNANDGQLLNMTQEDWVDGFELTTADVGVLGVASPSIVGSGLSTNETIKVEVKNFANNPISNFDISYSINGEDAVTETVTEEIAAFDTYIHTFGETVDLSAETEVEITAYTTLEGDLNADNNAITEVIAPSLEISIFNEERHNYGSYGQVHTKTMYLPENLDNYSEIYMTLSLTCPTGGCDPWDQPAKVSILKNGETWEISRYITPYGTACGDWTWDITDFRSLLVDKVEWESYVQVWGASGWLVTLDLEFIEGEPEYNQSHIQKLWSTDNWVYGDPDISYDFPAKTISIFEGTDAAKIRMTMTGHGQGNTDNAAEFSDFTHHISVNGTETFEQHLWKTDCNINTCSPQGGTWQYARAGWCPGQDVQPWEWDMDGHFIPGQDVTLDFVLQAYTNSNNGGYNGSSHTEPHYRCHTYFVQYSNGSFSNLEEMAKLKKQFNGYPNPTKGLFTVVSEYEPIEKVDVYNIYGKLMQTYPVNFKSKYKFNISELPSGIYMIKVKSENRFEVLKTILKR